MKYIIQKSLFINNRNLKNKLKKIILNALCVSFCISFISLLHSSKLISAPANRTETKKLSPEKINYIINKYEHTKIGTGAGTPCKAHLFYPAKSPKRLIIVFTSANSIGRYNLFSWFWNDNENWDDTAYLFLKDDQECWYLGNAKQNFVPEYSDIIKHYINICKLQNKTFTNNNVSAIGNSMGGYAAIFYATKLELNAAIALNPQADKKNALTGFKQAKNAEINWQDLDQIIKKAPKAPSVFLIYGHYPQDIAACDRLINVLKDKSPMLLVRRHDSRKHAIGHLIYSKELIEKSLNFIENQKDFAQDS
ncbi:MAG: hypothetical protein ABH827_02435 [bacterium]